MALCRRTERKNPAAEAPVKRKNFLSFPSTFSLSVKIIKATPNRKKTANGNKNRIEPESKSLNAGMKKRHTIVMKTATNAQNMDQLNFPFTYCPTFYAYHTKPC